MPSYTLNQYSVPSHRLLDFFFLSENIFILLWMTTLNPGKLGDKRARRLESAHIIRTSADINIWKGKKRKKCKFHLTAKKYFSFL